MQTVQRAGGSVADADRLQSLGDLITANIYRIGPASEWVEVEDYTRDNEPLTIELDPAKSAQANAQSYYDRASRTRRRAQAAAEELRNLESRLERLRARLEAVDDMEVDELERIAAEETRRRGTGDRDATTPGLRFESHGFTILVGRNARENDALLRRHVRGNDLWLHARDYPGGYVFVKSVRGKTVPLDVLLDAGNLAVHFSKAKSSGRADLYYTQVKHLRRARNGPLGLVLPTQEKNLHVVTEDGRLSRLLGRDVT
jgi:predicted ribosome quality control (RQC) complex YloA/Tae2 family protein